MLIGIPIIEQLAYPICKHFPGLLPLYNSLLNAVVRHECMALEGFL
jgi:hypothetical protein